MSSSPAETSSSNPQLSRVVLYVLGGLCVGGAILTAVLGGFTMPGGATSQVFPRLGYEGIGDLTITTSGMIAVGMFICGVVLLVTANATAWKETGGY